MSAPLTIEQQLDALDVEYARFHDEPGLAEFEVDSELDADRARAKSEALALLDDQPYAAY